MESSNNNTDTDGPQPSIPEVSDFGTVKIVKIAQSLPQHERDAIYNAACANQKAFQPPGGPGAKDAETLYLSLESETPDGTDIGPILEASQFLSNRIMGQLPTLFAALEVEPFAVSKVPLTLINGLDGHGGIPHADSIDGRFKISLLYYFHRKPKAFCGGDLEIYDTVAESPNGHSDEALTSIDHEDNLLIAFTSQTFHRVTHVQCDSDNFADGRFVAVVFLGPQ